MAEKTLVEKVGEIMSGIWVSQEKQEEALRQVLSGQDKETAFVDAIATGVKKALEKEEPLTPDQENELMLKQMYPSLANEKVIKEPEPDATLHQILYPNSYADMMKGKE